MEGILEYYPIPPPALPGSGSKGRRFPPSSQPRFKELPLGKKY